MIACILELLPLAKEYIVARDPLGREGIAHGEIDNAQRDKYQHNFDRRGKPLADSAQQEKSAERVDIGTVEQQLLAVGVSNGGNRRPFRTDYRKAARYVLTST